MAPARPPTARPDWSIQAVGDSCLLIEFGSAIEASTSQAITALASYLRAHPIKGVVDIVPAFTTLALHYDPLHFAAQGRPFECLAARVRKVLGQQHEAAGDSRRTLEIPVCYVGEHGPDIGDVESTTGLTTQDVVRMHAGSDSRVYMIGFAPGHPYAGMLDARLSVPRRATPRTAVPAGSVAIANGLTIIYPMLMPGGWNIIGRTPLPLFRPHAASPCLLDVGDRLRFVPISPERFQELAPGSDPRGAQ